MTSPMHRDNLRAIERRHMTVEKCDAGNMVMKHLHATCSCVKVHTEAEGKLLVVKTDKEARTTRVRETCQ